MSEQERFIIGYAELSEFLIEHGYPLTKPALMRLGPEGKGPPVAGSWSNAYTFRPGDVLAWARERALKPRLHRGRKCRTIVQIPPAPASAPAPVQEALPPPPTTTPVPRHVHGQLPPPPPPAPVVAASPRPQLGEVLPPPDGRSARRG